MASSLPSQPYESQPSRPKKSGKAKLSAKNQKMLAFLEQRIIDSETEEEDPTWVQFEEELRESRKSFNFREVSWDD